MLVECYRPNDRHSILRSLFFGAMHDVRAIANWFLERAERDGEQLTAMKLQKLAYLAHGWHFAFFSEPLVHDVVEAWQWGPVFRSLYREFAEFGSKPIDRRAVAFDGADLEEKEISIEDYEDADRVERLLEAVWQRYGGYSAGQLSDLTHRTGTPWHQMVQQMGGRISPFAIIPNTLIAEHYKKLLHERPAVGVASN